MARTRRHKSGGTSFKLKKDDALYQACHAGVIGFLRIDDIVNVLNVCRVMRFDEELWLLALANSTTIASHLFQRCSADVMDSRPSYLGSAVLLEEVCNESHGNTDPDHLILLRQRLAYVNANEGKGVALLSTLAWMERKLFPLCYQDDIINTTYGDICTARPILIPLPVDSHTRVTKVSIQSSLNKFFEQGFGDDFISDGSVYHYVSEFGAHWESIQTGNSPQLNNKKSIDTSCRCAFCDAAQQSIISYRRQAKTLFKKFTEVLKCKREKWKTHDNCDEDEMYRRQTHLKAEWFPEDSYPDINFVNAEDDEILADICESEQFQFNPFEGRIHGFERIQDDVYNALRGELLALCTHRWQPLKKELGFVCGNVETGGMPPHRIHRVWMEDAEGDGRVKAELVAGVTSTAFLVGVWMITLRADSSSLFPASLM